ncbi:DNA-formamidopyrimidine glycosylase [Desulfurispora thermophila]|uniref:DNA-formamidopyrimidine glycosylase n=1 Tax=Desulfurispora thermophila TaxID=265470 RepID=UPI0003642B68|nr:DNA-formamidopyrimidine glycosylase [Desulfurispora thermophila]
MPELPEVETIRRTLSPHITGRAVHRVEISDPRAVGRPEAAEFVPQLTGRTFLPPGRRGKYLLLPLENKMTLVAHLRMTGRLFYREADTAPEKHTRVTIYLDNGHALFFHDQRRFGRLYLLPDSELSGWPPLQKLGPEPLAQEFSVQYWQEMLTRHGRCRIKPLLLDQSCLAGLGNIYADEALHLAGIHPARCAGTLTPAEAAALRRAIRQVIQEGIAAGGTTFRDYRDGQGRPGGYATRLRVYRRENLPCSTCGHPIERRRIAGRSAHYCPTCQPEK